MEKTYPDYNNCVMNIGNSILKYYGLKQHHNSLKILDTFLRKKHRSIVLLLFDGLGSTSLRKCLGDQAFLRRNTIADITSVFPATTTAATTSITTGLTPAEHCWLGWDNYIKSIDKIVTLYENTVKGTGISLGEQSIAKQEFPYTTVMDLINKNTKAKAYTISPFDGIRYSSDQPEELKNKILELCEMEGDKFIYAYCIEPDRMMHKQGEAGDGIKQLIDSLNELAEDLSDKLSDTLLIISADHGHMTVADFIVLDDYPAIKQTLIREISLEPRATNFFVKKNLTEVFRQQFETNFANDFILLSKQEVLEKQLFGPGPYTDRFLDCLGDFISLAITNKAIIDTRDFPKEIGQHAGMLSCETTVPLVVIDKS